MQIGRKALPVLAVLVVSGALAACGSSSGSSGGSRRGIGERAPRVLCDPVMGAGTCDTTRPAICDYAADSGTFAGSLVAKRGAVATFRVDTVRSRPSPVVRHVPVTGRLIAVRYENADERFLNVGDDYAVKVWWLGVAPATPHFFSSVHTAARVCSGGTIHADGTPIDARSGQRG